ncbi:uncharacterized protein PGTG_20380 [Puccinia graminis f. sp. tritici CRL 75-36-700-3]|uniref:DNA polymerase epsilon subunit n=1 Tax=Puccinia graminis f. sp. tritici (strain CRL 75-36-700-3 / race SCCL) TaxID=418459 RepID=E3NXX5_PUCGT|nr:uncharacterized protein PGTG_20380 [Puccinia graminis f. sp. tritici CRL 75-36-700-3]EFP94424.2 hypothetical protein PGTG_20380 [Puccinia graminis f. sp. tritici CRL 75-36-700-3]
MPPTDQTRAIIHRIFSKEHSLILRGDGLRWIQDMLSHYRVAPADLEDTLNVLANECESYVSARDISTVIDQNLLQKVYEKISSMTAAQPQEAVEDADQSESSHILELQTLKVIDAFSIPRLRWSEERKMFEEPTGEGSKPSLLGQPISKISYLRDRYHTIRQVIFRNEHFSPPAVAGALGEAEREEYMKLTSSNNLLGRAGQRFLLFGRISRMKDQSYCLEDLEGWVKLDLSIASAAEGLFTEGCLVLAEGEYQSNETFKVLEIGHPPSEQRGATRKLFANIDFSGAGPLSLAEEARLKKREQNSDSQFIVMSDFHLDNPNVLGNFEQILQGYQDVLIESNNVVRPPALWILCGNFFQSHHIDGTISASTNFSKFSLVTEHIHLIFVPGPNDPWDSTMLPRQALPASIVKPLLHSTSQIPSGHLHFGSNPCRIRWMSQEIVIFRENLASKMCRNVIEALKDPTIAADEEDIDITKFLVQTILDQAHLSPFPITVSPVLWEHDQALRLYPMPTALVLADSYPAYTLTYEGCHVFNPGSFGIGSRPVWANYHVATRTSEQRQA